MSKVFREYASECNVRFMGIQFISLWLQCKPCVNLQFAQLHLTNRWQQRRQRSVEKSIPSEETQTENPNGVEWLCINVNVIASCWCTVRTLLWQPACCLPFVMSANQHLSWSLPRSPNFLRVWKTNNGHCNIQVRLT